MSTGTITRPGTAATTPHDVPSPACGRRWPAGPDEAENRERELEITRDSLASFDAATRYEWLVTNGIGGFASGTVAGANTRRYHGLLIASLEPPLARVMMVAKLDVCAVYRGIRHDLSANEFVDGTQTHGYRYLERFRLDGTLPVWTYLIGDAVLEQRVWMAHGANTTYVSFSLLRGERIELELTPLCGYRDYHWQQRGPREMHVAPLRDGLELTANAEARRYRILSPSAAFETAPDWYWHFKHRLESERGLDDAEDLFRPARMRVELATSASAAVVLTAEHAEPMPADAALDAERSRQRRLIECANISMRANRPAWIDQLVQAADQFVVARTSGRPPLADGRSPIAPAGATVIAGYPWFGDWGRDTMIALPGLTLTTGRYDIAANVLRTFARFVSEGMLPNRFPDAGAAPEYNTVDATLWYFVAIDEYWRATRDLELVRTLYPVLGDIIAWHVRGTRYGIGMDERDALLRSGAPGMQLTWMDAKIGDWVVTPRTGKAVEINALWFNALRSMQAFATALGNDAKDRYRTLADRAASSFAQRFWFADGNYLYDVIDTPDGTNDASLRPNQLFALSLRHALITGERARAVVDLCARELWTPVGMRSLAALGLRPGTWGLRKNESHATSGLTPQVPRPIPDGRYAPVYTGSPHQRDAIYHQGTVWGWLLGPFALAHVRAYGDAARARAYLDPMAAHLRDACLGQIGEIFDGDAPHAPRGCYAQAWSVAETLRAWSELNGSER